MITIRTTADSKTFNSKDALKCEGFTFDKASKSWTKEYSSIEEFKTFETKRFRSATFGRRQARENEAVKFEVVEEIKTVETKVVSTENRIENGECSLTFMCGGREAKLDGFFVTEIATGRITDIRVLKTVDPDQYAMFIDFLVSAPLKDASKNNIKYIANQLTLY